jgi:hypothetical protein
VATIMTRNPEKQDRKAILLGDLRASSSSGTFPCMNEYRAGILVWRRITSLEKAFSFALEYPLGFLSKQVCCRAQAKSDQVYIHLQWFFLPLHLPLIILKYSIISF